MLAGAGNREKLLTERQVVDLCREAFMRYSLDGKSLLVIIPDNSRSGPIDLLFRTLYDLLADRVSRLDFLIALGTHPPLTQEAIYRRVGIENASVHHNDYPKARFFNHHWKDPDQLKLVGTISREEVLRLSNGLLDREIPVTINKMVYDYDTVMILGPTFPHEVVGFSGGNKYFFPGISGQEIIDAFHWLGALITSARIIGAGYTPVREIVDTAAKFLTMEKLCISLVVKDQSDLHGMYIGSPEEAWQAAADLSAKVHVVYADKPYHRVLSRVPEMYEDLWTGGKGMYKLEPVVADGGELIIYGPHIKEVSVTHGEILEQIGYHVRDFFVKQMDKYLHIPGGLLAHSTHVKGMGNYESGVETPRITVTLATGIPEDKCRQINLGYLDPASIRTEEWENREDEGILYVPKAGEMLYRLKEDPFRNSQQTTDQHEPGV